MPAGHVLDPPRLSASTGHGPAVRAAGMSATTQVRATMLAFTSTPTHRSQLGTAPRISIANQAEECLSGSFTADPQEPPAGGGRGAGVDSSDQAIVQTALRRRAGVSPNIASSAIEAGAGMNWKFGPRFPSSGPKFVIPPQMLLVLEPPWPSH